MAEQQDILVFSEKPGLLAELTGGARQIASESSGRVIALVLGPREQAEQAARSGADRVFWLGEAPPDRLVDDYLATIAGLVERERPGLVLVGSTKRGRAIAGRLAARLGVSAVTDVREIKPDNGAFQARHMIFGGGAVRVEKTQAQTVLATAGAGVFHAAGPTSANPGEIVEVPFVEPPWKVTLRERKPRPAAQVNLGAAKKVVCLGRGIARREDLAQMEELAHLMGAEIGCSRPLAEGLDWLPRERYIGISGAQIRPDLYLGVGVSGQVQHMIGMSGSRVVAAINKDSSAPIFSHADYGIAGDLYQVVPALIKALQARK